MPGKRITPTIVALALSASVAFADTPATTVAEFPAGTFLENLTVAPSGDVVFTSYFARQLKVLNDANSFGTLAELPAHPVSVLAVPGGYIATAHGTAFTEGPGFTRTQQILRLDQDGAVTGTIAVADARFLNGMTRLSDKSVLIADSIAGTIWRFDVEDESITPWLHHDLLSQNPDIERFVPGANGIKVDGERVLVSNSGRGAIYEIALEGTDASSEPVLLARTGPIDDFWIDGTRIIFTTHGAELKALEPDGAITTLLADGCDGCTAVVRHRDAYLVLTTGGVLEGHGKPARILKVQAN